MRSGGRQRVEAPETDGGYSMDFNEQRLRVARAIETAGPDCGGGIGPGIEAWQGGGGGVCWRVLR